MGPGLSTLESFFSHYFHQRGIDGVRTEAAVGIRTKTPPMQTSPRARSSGWGRRRTRAPLLPASLLSSPEAPGLQIAPGSSWDGLSHVAPTGWLRLRSVLSTLRGSTGREICGAQ